MTAARVYTARISYRGPDRLDITRKSATGHGLAFAPSWEILGPALADRRHAERLRRKGDHAGAGRVEFAAWEEYVPAFIAEMRASYRTRRDAWEWLLSQPEVTLCCYCTDHMRCHRTILARKLLPTLGALYEGERE